MPEIPKKKQVTIDVEKEFWKQIKQAAEKSIWIPEDYYMNDWVNDVCYFLVHGYKGTDIPYNQVKNINI